LLASVATVATAGRFVSPVSGTSISVNSRRLASMNFLMAGSMRFRSFLATILTSTCVSVAQAGELPRQLPAVVAIPSEYATADILLVQSIEPVPDGISVSSPPEMIEAPALNASEPMYADGMPDVFPDVVQPFALSTEGVATCEECAHSGDGECGDCTNCQECWTYQLLPDGIIYHSYLAGPKEPRLAAAFWNDSKLGWQLDYTVGGRFGLLRYGTADNIWPQGWQVDIEGAAFPRVNLDENLDLDAADYRVGIPLTYGRDRWQAKLAIYHLSAHVGDEFLIRNPSFERRNYVRDAVVAGLSWYPANFARLYGEIEYGFNLDGGAEPWALQFGFELSPLRYNGCGGDPFLAMNVSSREDVDFGGNLSLQVGWQWRGYNNRKLLRTGLHFLTGKSTQFEFFRQHEDQVGIGFWYDF
jgi:hypothetical protein